MAQSRGVLGQVGVWFGRDTPDAGVELIRGRVSLETDWQSRWSPIVLVLRQRHSTLWE